MKFGSFVAVALLVYSTVASAEEWGALKGRFKFGGSPPEPSALKADKDAEVCGKHKLLSEELVVGADGGLANVVVFVRDKDVKVHPEMAALKNVKTVMDNKDCRFEPHVVFVQTGQSFVIKNSDTVGHNSNIQTIKNPAENKLIPAGGEAAATFKSDEAIPAAVSCNIHPWMKAWVVIRDNPYAAVSKPDGSFEIKNLPAGELEFQFWHEKAGYLGEATVGGKAEKMAKGRKKLKIAAGDNDLGEIVLDGKLFQK